MTGRRAKNWGKYVYEYTDIKNYSGAKYPGCGRRVKCEELDQQVWGQIVHWLNTPKEIAAAAEEMSDIPSSSFEEMEMDRLEKEIEKTKKGRKRLLNLFAQGMDISEEEVRETIRELKEKEDQLRARLEEIQDMIKDRRKPHIPTNSSQKPPNITSAKEKKSSNVPRQERTDSVMWFGKSWLLESVDISYILKAF